MQNPAPIALLNELTANDNYPGTRWYGNTKQGKFMSEADACAQGYRPSNERTVISDRPVMLELSRNWRYNRLNSNDSYNSLAFQRVVPPVPGESSAGRKGLVLGLESRISEKRC